MVLSRRSFLKIIGGFGLVLPLSAKWTGFQTWRKREFDKRLEELDFNYYISLGNMGDGDPLHQRSTIGVKATLISSIPKGSSAYRYIEEKNECGRKYLRAESVNRSKVKQWGMWQYLTTSERDYFSKTGKEVPTIHVTAFSKGIFLKPLGEMVRDFRNLLVRASLPFWKRWLI